MFRHKADDILMSSVIYYCTDSQQHGILLCIIERQNVGNGGIILASVILQIIRINQNACMSCSLP